MKKILKNSDLSLEKTDDIGLFTFYKQQQQAQQIQKNQQYDFIPHQISQQSQKYAVTQFNENSQKLLNKNDDKIECEDFLNNIKRRKSKKIHLTKKYKNFLTENTQLNEKDQIKDINNNNGSLFYNREIANATRNNNKIKDEIILSADYIRNKYFNKQKMTFIRFDINKKNDEKLITRSRFITKFQRYQQKDNKNQQQRSMIISKPLFFQNKIRKKQQKVNKQQKQKKNENIQFLTFRQENLLKYTIKGQLHKDNQKYFNNLIKNTNIKPQCNQTVYQMLRKTLKIPRIKNSRQYLKTQGNSPNKNSIIPQNYKAKVKIRQRRFKQQSPIKNILQNYANFHRLLQS